MLQELKGAGDSLQRPTFNDLLPLARQYFLEIPQPFSSAPSTGDQASKQTPVVAFQHQTIVPRVHSAPKIGLFSFLPSVLVSHQVNTQMLWLNQ